MGTDDKQETQPTVFRPGPGSAFKGTLAVLLMLGGINFNFILVPILLYFLPTFWALMLLGLLVFLTVIPLYEDSKIARGVATFICKHAATYFPYIFVMEDINAFDPDQTYIFAVEPHSIMTVGIVALSSYAGFLPLAKMKCLGTYVVFLAPIVRHIWSWLGLVPASMKSLLKYLKAGYNCVVIPGGVREVVYLEHDREVVVLKHRYGFVRASIQTGSPLVPAFIFGQNRVYHWYKPKGKLYERLSRTIGAAPILFWGKFGLPIPFRKPIYVAVGRPIEVQKNAEPSFEEVEELHAKFLSAFQELFEKHKVAAGHSDTCLHIL